MKTTGKYCEKLYKCAECGHERFIGTNHWGECYSWRDYSTCPSCPPYKRPNTWVCCEKPPKGTKLPTPWKKVTLKIVVNKSKRPNL